MKFPLDLPGVCRLLDEDPETWRADALGDLTHGHLPIKLEFLSNGTPKVNGFTLGWWQGFVLRRAMRRYWRRSVDRYLAIKAEAKLTQEMAAVDRLLNG